MHNTYLSRVKILNVTKSWFMTKGIVHPEMIILKKVIINSSDNLRKK